MRSIWSEITKRRLWREIWVALAQVQAEFGLVSAAQVDDLIEQKNNIDLSRALQIEGEIHHDLMAELKTFAEQCPQGGAILHLGATSMDIEDNADALRIRHSLDLILEKLVQLLTSFADQVDRWSDFPIIAFTHLQPAEPTTLGYRLAFTAQDLLQDWETLSALRSGIKGKGFKGSVGTGAAYIDLIGSEHMPQFEQRLSSILGLSFFSITHQTAPRKQEYQVISSLAGLAATLHKFAFDLRLLQSPSFGELAEPFRATQVGSSAMPFKRNPILAEKIDSLARLLAQLPRLAWDNAALSLLERTLDDSANRRVLLPEAFLTADELLLVGQKIVSALQVDEGKIRENLSTYGSFAATERLLMALAKAGADRQEIHARLRAHALQAWEVIQQGKPNNLVDQVARDPYFQGYLPEAEIRQVMQLEGYLGIAPQRARELAAKIRSIVR